MPATNKASARGIDNTALSLQLILINPSVEPWYDKITIIITSLVR